MDNSNYIIKKTYTLKELKSIYGLYSFLVNSRRKTIKMYPGNHLNAFKILSIDPIYNTDEAINNILSLTIDIPSYKNMPVSTYFKQALNPLYHIFTFDQLFGNTISNPHRYPNITNYDIKTELSKLKFKAGTELYIMPKRPRTVPRLTDRYCFLSLYSSKNINRKFEPEQLEDFKEVLIGAIKSLDGIYNEYEVEIRIYNNIKDTEITICKNI